MIRPCCFPDKQFVSVRPVDYKQNKFSTGGIMSHARTKIRCGPTVRERAMAATTMVDRMLNNNAAR